MTVSFSSLVLLLPVRGNDQQSVLQRLLFNRAPSQGLLYGRLEPDESKGSSPVLRGERAGNSPALPGNHKLQTEHEEVIMKVHSACSWFCLFLILAIVIGCEDKDVNSVGLASDFLNVISDRDISKARSLIEDGVDVNMQDKDGVNALMIATKERRYSDGQVLNNAGCSS